MLRWLVNRVVVCRIFAEHKTNVHCQQTHTRPVSVTDKIHIQHLHLTDKIHIHTHVCMYLHCSLFNNNNNNNNNNVTCITQTCQSRKCTATCQHQTGMFSVDFWMWPGIRCLCSMFPICCIDAKSIQKVVTSEVVTLTDYRRPAWDALPVWKFNLTHAHYYLNKSFNTPGKLDPRHDSNCSVFN